MAVKMVFEDNENTPSSILLKSTYHGSNIYFSGGVSQLLNKAMTIREKNDIVYMFYDMSPNSKKTVKGYETLVLLLKSDKIKYKDMYVIPIICIEYYICQMFYRYKYFYKNDKNTLEMIEKLVKTFDWTTLPDNIKQDKYINQSLEHAYKKIISSSRLPCLKNRFQYDTDGITRIQGSPRGIFYEKDCECKREYCGLNSNDKLIVKAERLYRTLPLFAVEANEHKTFLQSLDINIKKLSNSDIEIERKAFYSGICNNMKLNMPKISV